MIHTAETKTPNMKKAADILDQFFKAEELSDDQYHMAKQAINEARIEAIKECAEKVKIVRNKPDPFGRTETALGSQQRDYVDKHSILNLILQVK